MAGDPPGKSIPFLLFLKRSMSNNRVRYGNYSKEKPVDAEYSHFIIVAAFGFDDYGCDDRRYDRVNDYGYIMGIMSIASRPSIRVPRCSPKV